MNNRNRKTNKNNKNSKKNRRNNNQQVGTITIPKSFGMAFPDRYRCTLRFWKSIAVNLSSSNTAGDRFQPSGAYDIDPLVGGASMAGYNQLAAVYSIYRVSSSRIKVEIANTSPTSIVNVTVVPVNVDPTSSPTSAVVLAARDQSYAKSKTCTPLGGPLSVITHSMSTKKIYGNKMTEIDDNFASQVTTVPSNNWYWFISYYTLAVIPLATPILANIFIEVDIEFYDKIQLP